MNSISSTDKNQWFIIANANAGGKTKKKAKQLQQSLRSLDIEHQFHFSNEIADVNRLLKEATKQGFRRIGIMGGDGSFHHAVNCIMQLAPELRDQLLFSFIPSGTGNDWVKTTQIPSKAEACSQLMKKSNSTSHDLGCISFTETGQKHYFLNIAGLGYDSYLAANYLSTNKAGPLTYLYALVRGLHSWKNHPCEIKIDGQQYDSSIFILAAGIGKFFGGGMKVCPDAITNDGYFDISLIGDLSKWEIIKRLPKIYTGNFFNDPRIKNIRGTEIEISSAMPLYVQADGELLGHTPMRFSILPNAIRAISE
ncbi:diacylglycerol kinase family lipid kinase [Chitinophagales bacterium]|nr:diacylglycerol kinase family lipid kinase [Chitinophagales bacterium]